MQREDRDSPRRRKAQAGAAPKRSGAEGRAESAARRGRRPDRTRRETRQTVRRRRKAWFGKPSAPSQDVAGGSGSALGRGRRRSDAPQGADEGSGSAARRDGKPLRSVARRGERLRKGREARTETSAPSQDVAGGDGRAARPGRNRSDAPRGADEGDRRRRKARTVEGDRRRREPRATPSSPGRGSNRGTAAGEPVNGGIRSAGTQRRSSDLRCGTRRAVHAAVRVH